MQHLLFWKCTQKPKVRFNQQTGLTCACVHTHKHTQMQQELQQQCRERRPVTSRPKVIFYLKCWVCSKIHAPNCLALLMKGCMTGSPVSVPCIMCRSITGYEDGAYPAGGQLSSWLLHYFMQFFGIVCFYTYSRRWFYYTAYRRVFFFFFMPAKKKPSLVIVSLCGARLVRLAGLQHPQC